MRGTCRSLLHKVQLLPEGRQLWVLLPHRQRNEVQKCHLPVCRLGVQELQEDLGKGSVLWDGSLGVPGSRGGAAHQVQALQFEAIDCTAFAAVHVVSQRQDDLQGQSSGIGGSGGSETPTGSPSPSYAEVGVQDPHPARPHIPTSNMCFSFWDDFTEAEAAMMALSCCRGTGRGGSAGARGAGTPPGRSGIPLPSSVPASASGCSRRSCRGRP